ncbi:MAG: prolipoprotein diacylglyceryl transferase [Chloroflexota bacterium]|nr:prolipoprotein diacylglyceryl transferase [Chloroflexota bacterium]
MPIAVVRLDFDPVLRAGGSTVRLETVVVAIGLVLALLLAAWIVGRPGPGLDPPTTQSFGGRMADLMLIVLAVVPGALVGGRVGYALLYLDYYLAHSGAFVDPAQGSLELVLGVVGGTITGAYAASALGGRTGPWLDAAAMPTLLALAVGKVAMALGGDGQGLPSNVPWATSYVGPGPWGSLAPAIASHPSQLYEAGATVLVLALVVAATMGGAFRRRDGLALFVALGGWAIGRAIVATTWRDAPVLGPLGADQLLCLGLAAACVGAAMVLARRAGDSGAWSIVERPPAGRARRDIEQREVHQ